MVTKERCVRVTRLAQDVPVATDRTVFDVVAEGLGGLSDLVADYQRTAVAVAKTNTPRLLERLGGLQHDPEKLVEWHIEQRGELVLSRLSLPFDTLVCADFFTTGVWMWQGLVTYYTVFVIDLASRRVQISLLHGAVDEREDYRARNVMKPRSGS